MFFRHQLSTLLFITILAFPVSSTQAKASNPASDPSLTAEELNWIAEHPIINVRVSRDYPPFEFFEDGEFKGYAYDFLQAIGKQTGLTFQPTPEMSWNEALERIRQKNGVDLVLLITSSTERESFLNFTSDYISFPYVIFTRKTGEFVGGLSDLQGKLVSVEQGFIEADILESNIPEARLYETKTTAEALQAVSNGTADAYLGNLAIGSHLIDKLGLTNLKVAAPAPYGNDSYAMGVRKDWPELASVLEKSLSSLSTSNRQILRAKWFPIRYEYGLGVADIIKWVLTVALILTIFIVQLKRMVKARTHELQTSQNLLQVVQDNAFQIIGLLTPDGMIRDINQTGLNYLQAKKEDLLGKPIWEASRTEDAFNKQQIFRQALTEATNGTTFRQEIADISTDGKTHYFDFSLKPVFNADKELIHLVVSLHDITKLKELQTQAIRSSQLASLGGLAAGVAHEVNNPIGGVINYAEILKRRIKTPEEQDIAAKIIKEGLRIANTVRALLSFSRDDGEQFKLCQIEDILHEPLSLMQEQTKRDGIAIELNIADNIGPIHCNAQQIRQVLLNLITNARHALNTRFPSEHSSKKIELSATKNDCQEGGSLCLTIKDFGSGIPDDIKNNIMQPFFTTKARGEGTGLGLSICADIMKNHGGSIEIDSKQDAFTEVKVCFPLVQKIQKQA